jgi:hypothetical protein
LLLSSIERWAKVAHIDRTSPQVVVAVSKERHQGTPKSSNGPLPLLLPSAPEPGLKLLLLADGSDEEAPTREPFRATPLLLLLPLRRPALFASCNMRTVTCRTAGVVVRWLLLFGLVDAAAPEITEEELPFSDEGGGSS